MTQPKKPVPPPGPDQPARAPVAPPVAPPVAIRVRQIREHLVARTWTPALAAELAATWGLGLATVQHDAAEASRQLEALLDSDLVRREVAGIFQEALDRARSEAKDAEASKALANVGKLLLQMHGVGAHRDPRNDPKPADKPSEGSNVVHLPPWKKKPA